MKSLFSKVYTNRFDAFAEVPVIGTISSLIRIPVSVLSILYNILKYPVSSHKEECKKNIKASVTGFSRGILEALPGVGNVVAYYLNKQDDIYAEKEFFNYLDHSHLSQIIEVFATRDSLSPIDRQTYKSARLEMVRRKNELMALDKMNLSQLKTELEKIRKNQSLTSFDNQKIHAIQIKIAVY